MGDDRHQAEEEKGGPDDMILEILTAINMILIGYLIAALLWQMSRFNKHVEWHRRKEAAADADKL